MFANRTSKERKNTRIPLEMLVHHRTILNGLSISALYPWSPLLKITYYIQKIGGMNNWHPWQLKKTKLWSAVLELPARQQAANLANLPQKLDKLVVLFSWYVAPKRLPGF